MRQIYCSLSLVHNTRNLMFQRDKASKCQFCVNPETTQSALSTGRPITCAKWRFMNSALTSTVSGNCRGTRGYMHLAIVGTRGYPERNNYLASGDDTSFPYCLCITQNCHIIDTGRISTDLYRLCVPVPIIANHNFIQHILGNQNNDVGFSCEGWFSRGKFRLVNIAICWWCDWPIIH